MVILPVWEYQNQAGVLVDVVNEVVPQVIEVVDLEGGHHRQPELEPASEDGRVVDDLWS